tara:strand:+ start:6641 stop:7498 length:858 start_codon:yes stop_codon:yes gene_type:complete
MSFIKEEISIIVSSDSKTGALSKSLDGSRFEIQLDGEGLHIPKDAMNVTVEVEEATIWWSIPNIITGENDKIYIYGDSDDAVPVPQLYTITVPQGLYDLSALNLAILSELESQGARTLDGTGASLPLISMSADSSTQKVRLRFNYPNVYVDFTQANTMRDILGFNSAVYGPYAGAPQNILADSTAQFNTVNYFLIHSDIVSKGVRFNNTYNQTIAQVLINVAPGSQIVSTPFNPARSGANELAGSRRTNLRFWLTDDQDRAINTNNENWSARIVIHYMRPMIIKH